MEVGLVQVNMEPTWSAAGLGGEANRYTMLPYSVGLLQAYAARHARSNDALRFRLPICARLPVRDAVDELDGCDLVGFSCYVWNERISLEIARELKRRRPETTVVFGGPQVPDRAEAFLRAAPFVDLVCHGEGEATFTEILDAAAERDWSGIDGLSRLDRAGSFHHVPRGQRLMDYSELPSPYLDGTFEPLLAASPDRHWIMMWETNRGCPFSCTFCDWGSATNAKVNRFELERLEAEIAWMSRKRVDIVYCADANFGILPRDVELTESIVASTRSTGFPSTFYVNSTKNATERAYTIQRLLSDAMGTVGVTIALQSNDPETLAAIKRQNISTEHYEELQQRFARDRLYTYTDLIIGLPGETYDTFADGVSHVVAHGQHNNVQFRNCYLLPNAELADPDYRLRHGLEVVSQELREPHAAVDEADEVPEFIDVVIATSTMPRADWVRAKTFAWLTDVLYFDRLLQLPFLLLGSEAGVPLRRLVELFADADPESWPTVARIVAELRAKACSIQEGGLEWFAGPDAGGILWPADQWTILTLVGEGLLDDFYAEAGRLLQDFLERERLEHHELVVSDALELNQALFNTPGGGDDVEVFLWHTVWERCMAVIHREEVPLTQHFTRYVVGSSPYAAPDMEDWYRQLVWCDWRDKRAYLRPLRTRLAGETGRFPRERAR